jgi:hypothetical protein
LGRASPACGTRRRQPRLTRGAQRRTRRARTSHSRLEPPPAAVGAAIVRTDHRFAGRRAERNCTPRSPAPRAAGTAPRCQRYRSPVGQSSRRGAREGSFPPARAISPASPRRGSVTGTTPYPTGSRTVPGWARAPVTAARALRASALMGAPLTPVPDETRACRRVPVARCYSKPSGSPHFSRPLPQPDCRDPSGFLCRPRHRAHNEPWGTSIRTSA